MRRSSTLLLLHGWGLASAVWQTVRPKIDSPIEVVAPDLPGYGESAWPSPYDLDHIVARLRNEHGGHHIICGWSMGGILAQYWAARYPNEVDGLVLLSSTPKFLAQDDWSFGMASHSLLQFDKAVAQDVSTALLRFVALQAYGDAHAKSVISRLRQVLLPQCLPSAHTLMSGLELLRQADVRDLSVDIRCPTLIIHGRRDQICPLPASEWLACAISNAHLSVHDGASHAVFISDPEWVGSVISDFVKSIDVRANPITASV